MTSGPRTEGLPKLSLTDVSTTAVSDGDCCEPGGDCCSTTPRQAPTLARRTLLGVAAAGALTASWALPDGAVAVPPRKDIGKERLRALATRGAPTAFRGQTLTKIGMPVGGACAGQVYLSGDGEPWLWDIFNPDTPDYGGVDWTGIHYADPLEKQSPFLTGFGVRVSGSEGEETTTRLDATGFDDVSFTGTYPIGRISFRSENIPIEIELAAYSPFVPGDLAASSLPTTVLEYTVSNATDDTLTCELLGMTENPVCLRSRRSQPIRLSAKAFEVTRGAGVNNTADADPVDAPTEDDRIFEDWSDGYTGWTVDGSAFGDAPVSPAELPSEMRRFGSIDAAGKMIITSYAFRGDGDPDAAQGSLISEPFTIEHQTLMTRVGGGSNGVAVRVVVEDKIIASATGMNFEPLRPVFLDLSEHQGQQARIEIVDEADGPWSHITVDRLVLSNRDMPRPDITVEDWASGTFDNWVLDGDAFGESPVTEKECPDYFTRGGPLNVSGEYFVTSHAFRDFPDAAQADERVGSLTGPEFTIERRYLAALIGGGAGRDQVGLRLLVDNESVAVLVGRNDETLVPSVIDVSAYVGRRATLQLLDRATGGWGHLNCDRIWFSDLPLAQPQLDELTDAGTFALTCFDSDAEVRTSVPAATDVATWFADDDHETGDASTVSVRFRLEAGEQKTVRFAYSWNFPTISAASFGLLTDFADLSRHYATRFDTAVDVAEHLDRHLDQLVEDTASFVRTWYADSTLPHWLLERTLASASTVATETCHRFSNGRFYAWEGTYCCVGTCTHVWNYAQSLAYLFPELERDARSRTDYGTSFHLDTGAIDYRGEWAKEIAHDGQCGNILRTYREHQMSADDQFLSAIWPSVKKSVEFLIKHDGTDPNGVFEAEQYNTLDSTWYGEIPWITGLYVAALRASAEMASDMDDDDFAATCTALADSGSDYLSQELWNDEYGYFEQQLDDDHADSINSNRGCYLDQMFGQTYAHQLGLPRVFEASKARTALASIYRNNFLPDAQAYQDVSGIEGGRAFSTEGEAGTLMCTWPFGGQAEAPGAGEPFAIGYFNEVWTGQEYQFAAHLLSEGMVDEGLAVLRAVHDRYSDGNRNPFNEVECSDHYARAMMSHSAYLAACGFSYHGPRGQLGFDPQLSPENFRAAFTVAEGWGSYWQKSDRATFRAGIELRHGKLRGLRSLVLNPPQTSERLRATITSGGSRVRGEIKQGEGHQLMINFSEALTLSTGDDLTATIHF